MGRAIIELVQLAMTVAFAAPVALLGAIKLGAGETLIGATLLAIAAGMIAVEEYLITPGDLPAAVVQRTLGRSVADPEDEK